MADAMPLHEGEIANKSRFTLDATVEAEGANPNVGERSLLSLDSKLVGMYLVFSHTRSVAHIPQQFWTYERPRWTKEKTR